MGSFDNARSELETFDEVMSFLEGVAMSKLATNNPDLLQKWTEQDSHPPSPPPLRLRLPLPLCSWLKNHAHASAEGRAGQPKRADDRGRAGGERAAE